MISKVAILLVILTRTLSQVCKEAVDISKGTHHPHEVIYHNGIKYEQEDYFLEDGKEMGCICIKKQCIRKCCPFGFAYDATSKVCVSVPDEFDPPVWDTYRLLEGKKSNDTFHFTFGKMNCNLPEFRVRIGEAANIYHLRTDGQLFIEMPNTYPPWSLRGPDKYCIDTFVTTDDSGNRISKLDALICFAEKVKVPQYLVSCACMLVSCVFIMATVAVYAFLPELRNLHGRVMMTYLLCLFFGFLLLASLQIMLYRDSIYPYTCVGLTIAIYFSLESAFFWLNAMCFDIWWTFSGKRGLSDRLTSTRARFLAYCVYAFGIPTVLTILMISLEFSGLPAHPLMPMLRKQGCFLFGNSKLIYLYIPVLLVCLCNMVFFVLTLLKIQQIKRQTSVLKSKDNGTHDQHSKDKQRLVLYIKLFMVMGINWILEVISSFYPDLEFWVFTDAYNVLIGLFIFIIFVCKRKIFRLIKKRIKGIIQKPVNEELDEMKELSNAHIRRRQMIDQRASQETIRTSVGSAYSNKNVVNILI